MKKIKKITILLLMLFIIFSIFQTVNAFGFEDLGGTPIDNSEIRTTGNKIITAISTIGSIISVIVLVVLGIKYMAGSVEEKAEYKKSLLPYVIGAVLVFAASSIAGIVYTLVAR